LSVHYGIIYIVTQIKKQEALQMFTFDEKITLISLLEKEIVAQEELLSIYRDGQRAEKNQSKPCQGFLQASIEYVQERIRSLESIKNKL
jgi:hypothetical protein